ncbi:unnamed protein product [Closterium sp. NIES-64]|nr:unnamed protein product [Closterium sp. NIES-64]
MVGAVGDAGVVDTLEARLENARRKHEANEYGDLPWAVVEAGTPLHVGDAAPVSTCLSSSGEQRRRRRRWASTPGGGQVGSSVGGTLRISVTPPTGRSTRHSHLEGSYRAPAGDGRLIGFARGTVATPGEHHPDMRAEFRAVQLLTFTVISRCCSPGVEIALKWCREYIDAGHRAWDFIESTYQVTDDLFIAQLEGQLTHLRMGDEETATDYYNRARRILATIRMAGAQYSTASYITHVMQGLSSSYNLLKRLSMAPSTRATLNEDNLTSYILQDEAMEEAECDSDDDDKGGRGRSSSRRPCQGGNRPRKEKQSTKMSTSAKDADSPAGGKARDDKTASVLAGRRRGADRLAGAGGQRGLPGGGGSCAGEPGGGPARQRAVAPSPYKGRPGSRYSSPTYCMSRVCGSNLLSSGLLKEHGVKLQEDGEGMMLVSEAGVVLGRATLLRARPLHRPASLLNEVDVAPRRAGDEAVVESVRTLLLHMGVQHHWWHLALRPAVWVRNCLERSALPPGTTPYQLLIGRKPDLSLVRGLHLGVSAASKGWELLDVDTDRVATTSDVVFYEEMSLAEWKTEHGSVSGRSSPTPPSNTSSATLPLLAEVGELAIEDVEDVRPPTPPPPTPAPPLVADLRGLTSVSASGDEGSSGTSPSAKCIAGGRRDERQVDVGLQSTSTGDEQVEKQVKDQRPTKEQVAVMPTKEQSATGQSAGEPTIGEKSAGTPTTGEKLAGTPAEEQQDVEGSDNSDDGGDAEEVQPGPRRSGRLRRPPDFFVPAAFTTMRALASWKGLAVKAAMEEEIRSLLNMGTWELVERPPGVNVMKNRWVLTTKYHVDDTVEREKARLVVKGFTQVYGADYDETFVPVGSYVTLRIFLSIVAVLDLNVMQLDMKNAVLQSKLDRVLYMSQPDYFNDGSGRVCKLLKSLYGLKQSPLLWYLALNDVLVGAGWKKSQVDEALYFKVGKDGVACWVLVHVDDLLATSSSAAMLKELLEAAFELREISPVQKYLGLEIVRDRSAGKLWLHQQGYTDRLRRRFIDEEQDRAHPEDAGLGRRLRRAHLRRRGGAGTPGIRVPEEGRLVAVRGDNDEAGHRLCLQQAGERPHASASMCATLSSTESEYVAATEAGKEGRRLCFLLAEFRQLDAGEADCPASGQQVGYHSRRGHEVDGQPQAHGAETGLAVAHGEAREVLAAVHPDR